MRDRAGSIGITLINPGGLATKTIYFFVAAIHVLILTNSPQAYCQDNSDGREPIDESIQPSALRFYILVDARLEHEDPQANRFKSLQAAYQAAAEGTADKPTVIGIRPGVYLLPGGENGASLNIEKNYITLLGLTNNRRAVVLADNRGHAQGERLNLIQPVHST